MPDSEKNDLLERSNITKSSAENSSHSNASIPSPVFQLKEKNKEEEGDKVEGSKQNKLLSGNSGDEDDAPLDQNKWKSLFPNVKFHFNSDKPGKIGAVAYSQGSDVHFAKGKDSPNIVAHELTHVTQQGVPKTEKRNGVNINADAGLEAEADRVASEVEKNGLQGVKSELGSLSSVPYSNSSSDPAQLWPDWVDDAAGAVGDAWDSGTEAVGDAWDSGTEAVGDAWDATTDFAGELGEAAMEKALSLIDDVESLLSFLASLSVDLAKKAMRFVARNMRSLFIELIKAAPGSEYIIYGIEAILDFYSITEVISFLQEFGESTAKSILRLISSINLGTLKDIVLSLPGYALSGFIIALMSAQKVLEIVTELAVDKLKTLIEVARNWGAGIRKLLSVIAANIEAIYTKIKAALIALGTEIVEALIRAYNVMMQIVKYIVEKIWPVGAGVQLDGGIGATFGIPIYVGVNYTCYIVHESPGVFKLFRRGVVKGGLDTGVGAGLSIGSGRPGAGSADDSGSLMIGAEAGANAGAGLQAMIEQEYQFPIYQDLAFLSFLATATGTDTGVTFGLASKLLQPTGANLDPMVYNIKTKFQFGVYAEASAEANIGVKVGNDHTGGETQRWDNHNREGENDSRPDSLGGYSGAPWYARGMLLRKLRASIGGNIRAEANMGVEMRQGRFEEDENGARVPKEVELDIYGEGTFAASLAASLPVPVPIPNLGIDTTLGLKATYKFVRNGNDDDISVEYQRYSAYINGGDMDVIDGPATENEISLQGDTDLGFQEFLDEANVSFRRKQRLSLESPFGRSFQSRANRQEFTRVLNGNGRNFGANVAGYLTYEFKISSANAKRILASMGAFHQERIANGEWQFLIDDLITFFTTGQMAPYIESFLDEILSFINVTMLQARWSASMGVAADGSAGAGAKVRLHGNLSAGVFRNYDLLGEGETLTVQEIRELLTTGASALDLSGEEQQMVPAGGGQNSETEAIPEADAETPDFSIDQPQTLVDTAPLPLTGDLEDAAYTDRTPEQEDAETSYSEEQVRAIDSVKYELIAHGMAYTTVLDDQQKAALEDMGLTGWADTVNRNSETGLFAGLILPLNSDAIDAREDLTDADKAYLEGRRAVIAFRGSELGVTDGQEDEGHQTVPDWLHNDMDGYAVGHTAFNLSAADIEAMLEYAVNETGKRVVVTGHSLGGSLAKQCALHFPHYVEQVYSYQAPGISEEQEDIMNENAGTGKDILGRELSDEQRAELHEMLRNEPNKEHTMSDIEFMSHTSAGDIVHNAGGGRAPGAIRHHHHPAGIINGYTPAAHILYLTSSEEFTEQHAILNRIMQNDVADGASAHDQADVLFDNATHANNDIDPTRIKENSTETDSNRHETMEALRRALIGNTFNPQARLLVENPDLIEQIPVESKIIMLNNLLRSAGLNPFKHGADLRNGHRAVINLFVYSTPNEQLAMVNASGGLRSLYNRIDGILNNTFSERTSELRQAFRSGVLPIISEQSAADTIDHALDSGILGMGDNSEEKLISDILEASSVEKGKRILALIGGGSYNDGRSRVLWKLQGAEDALVREKYKKEDTGGWFDW